MDAAELRRQKILRNSNRRMELLLGIKKEAEGSEPAESVPVVKQPLLVQTSKPVESSAPTTDNNVVPRKRSSILFTKPLAEQNLASGQIEINAEQIDSNASCNFVGYSNLEVMVMFGLALLTSLLFFFDLSVYIYDNALLPFVTFELSHLLIHFKCLPSTSSQFQMFSTLLRLCGIPQKSLTNLMTVFNFLFILIDNFAIYLFSFVVVNFFLGLLV